MRGLGVHAGLALAGIIAGLPVAAVVQWQREPPDEVWSQVGAVLHGREADNSAILFSSHHWFFDAPCGRRVTSVEAGDGSGSAGSVYLSNLIQRVAPLRLTGMRLFRAAPRWYSVAHPLDEPLTVDGVNWHRVRLDDPR